MNSQNPELQKILDQLNERNREAESWQINFAEKILEEALK